MATVLRILLDDSPETRQTQAWLDAAGERDGSAVRGELTTVGALPGGMTSGAPSVFLHVKADDGRLVVAETSLANLLAAARAFEARYGSNPKGN